MTAPRGPNRPRLTPFHAASPRKHGATPKGRIGLVVPIQLAAGLVTALVLVAAPLIPAEELSL
jgi:hypothetical protein